MSMERFRRVAQLWNWLPGFRGVAEHHSIHQAAKTLAVSASALSRTVRLLEAELGAELFVRRTDGLELTTLGTELLAITRDAMRQVDECATREALRRGGLGPLHVAATTPLTAALVARALPAIGLSADGAVHVTEIANAEIEEALLQGNIDLVVTGEPPATSSLRRDHLGDARHGLYAATAALPKIGERREVAALIDGPDPTTAEIPCRVVVWCESVAMVRTLCERGPIIGVLPDLLADETALHRLGDLGDPVAVYALRRGMLPQPAADDRAGRLIASLRALLV